MNHPLLRSLLLWFRQISGLLTKSRNAEQSTRHRLLNAESLEARILYSAAPVDAPAAESADEAPAEAPAAAPAPAADMPASGEAAPSAAAPATDEAAPATDGASEIAADQNVVLVDAGAEPTQLNQQTLNALAEAAKQRWIDSGLTTEQTAALANISYQISDLGGNKLGLADGSAVTIDDDAGGSGSWFIDSTPGEDEEFQSMDGSATHLNATIDGGAFGHYDLLATILHEQGHVLGLADLPGGGGDVMNGLIDLNARRLPEAEQADGAVAGSLEGAHFLGGTGIFVDSGQALGSRSSIDVKLGDLDGDGDLDAVVGNSSAGGGTGGNRVWLNDGTGTFTDSGQTLGGGSGDSVDLGDVDGDGDLDVLIVDGASGASNRLWLNDGVGTLIDSGQALGTGAAKKVQFGDLDGDGDLDFFLANFNSQNRVFENDGSGTFTDTGQTLGSARAKSLALGDLDGDGDLDVMVGNDNQANRVLINDGTGTFTDSGQALGGSKTYGLSLGDVDGDGDLDAFAANDGGQSDVLWLNDGMGNFTVGASLGGDNGKDVKLGDVDGDGDLDAFVADYGQVSTVWLNDGSGNFTDSGQSLGNGFSRGVSLGDLDGDGDLDAFIANGFNQPNRVWLNQNKVDVDLSIEKTGNAVAVTQGGTITYTVTVTGDATETVSGATVADSFPDMLSDVNLTNIAVTGGATTTATTGLLGSNAFSETVDLPAGSTIVYTFTATVYDSNANDEAAAAILTNVATVSVSAAFNDTDATNNSAHDSEVIVLAATGGSGNFVDSGQSLGNSISQSVSLGDLDGDGDLDAFVGNASTTGLPGAQPNKVWINNGGVFTDSGQNLGSSVSRGVTLGDVDGDGDLDAFVVVSFSQPNEVWLNDGSGTFTDSGQALGSSVSRDVALGDIDGDGDLDAVIANASAGGNTVWKNDGSGIFTDSGQVLPSSSSDKVSLGDLDGDGDLDAFFANVSANKIWLNDGLGTFTVTAQSLGTGDSKSVSLGDVDGDGDLDAFVTNRYNSNQLWLNDGTGSFSPGQTVGSGGVSGTLGDLDGDGDLDVFFGSRFPNDNKIHLNNGDATFTDSGQSLGSSDSISIALGDLDGDGDLDAFVANFDDAPNKVWLNQNKVDVDLSITKTSGAVAVEQGGTITYTVTVTGDAATNVTAATVTDSFPDMLSDVNLTNIAVTGGATTTATTGVLGANAFSETADLPAGSSIVYTFTATVYGSNAADEAAAAILTNVATVSVSAAFLDTDESNNSAHDSEVIVLAATGGSGNFQIGQDNIGGATFSTAFGDLDGDGDLDLVLANRHQANRILFNDGAGNFFNSGQNLGGSASQTRSIALGDVDGDGDLDIVSGEKNSRAGGGGGQQNLIWLNDGLGNFSNSGQALGSQSTYSVALGDIDGDGDLDLVAGNVKQSFQSNSDGKTRIWVNDGAGVFTESTQTITSSVAIGVALGDIDGDGDLDIVEGTGNGFTKILLNDGAGVFTESAQTIASGGTRNVALGDIDGDGDLDIVEGNDFRATRILLNDGAGVFTISAQTIASSRTTNVALGDVDGDGDLDMVEGIYGQANKIWVNDGAGNFTESVQTFASAGTQSVALGDVDGDGDLDFVDGVSIGASVVWLNNNAPTAVDDNFSTGEDDALTTLGNVITGSGADSDPEMSALTVSAVTGGTVGSAFNVTTAGGRTLAVTLLADGTLSANPNGQFEALNLGDSDTATFDYTVTDGGATDTATVTITINGANEIATMATTTVTIIGTTLTIEDTEPGATPDNLTLFVDPLTGELVIQDPDNDLGGAPGTVNEIRVHTSLFTDLEVFTGGGDDQIAIGDLTGTLGSVTVDGGDGFDIITIFGDNTLMDDTNASLSAEHISGRDTTLATTGVGTITLLATGGSATESYHGIDLVGATLSTEDGDLTVNGEGGDSGTTNRGVNLVRSDLSTGSGDLSITGEGGLGSRVNRGIHLNGSNLSSSDGGDLTLMGTGGGTVDSQINQGVTLQDGSTLSTTGDGIVMITGIGGAGSNFNDGVHIYSGASISVADGDLSIAGTGGGTGSHNLGVAINAADLTSSGAGNIIIAGQGVGSGDGNDGVSLSGTSLSVTAPGTGTINITGTASATGSGGGKGIQLSQADLSTASTDIVINGTGGGVDGNNNIGVEIASSSTVNVMGGVGIIDIDGIAGGGLSNNQGALIKGGSSLGTVNGGMFIDGTGGGTLSYNRGVQIDSATVAVSGTGTMTIVGIAGGEADGVNNDGTSSSNGNLSTVSGELSITGNGGLGRGKSVGVRLSSVDISSSDAATSIIGVANANTTGNNNSGIDSRNSKVIGSTLNVTGTGGGGVNNNVGIRVIGGSLTASTGAATYIGTALGTTTGKYNTGVDIRNAEIGGVGGTNLSGIGGGLISMSGDKNHGIYLNGITVAGAAPNLVLTTKGFGDNSEDTEGDFFP